MKIHPIAFTLLLLGEPLAHAKDGFSFGAGVEVARDSNVFRLSETQIDKAGTDTQKGEKYYQMDSAADTILAVYGRVDYELRALRGKKANLRIEPAVELFMENGKRTHVSLDAELTHSLWKGGDLFVELEVVPSRYRKNYFVDGVDQNANGVSSGEKTYDAGSSTEVGTRAGVKSRLTDSLDGMVSIGFGADTYNSRFENRNQSVAELGAGLDLAVGKRLDLGLDYRGTFVGTGSDDEVVIENRTRIVTSVDRSYAAHAIAPSVRVELAKSIDVRAEYELMTRAFSSTGTNDPYRDRTDVRHTGSLELRVQVTKPLRITAGALMSRAITDRPNDADTDPDEVDWERTVAWLGLAASF